MAIFITQLIYIQPGAEKTFDEFEALAIPLIARYHGKMLMRLRPESYSFIEASVERPYEIHLVEFDSETHFDAFLKDETRRQFLHLKESSVRSAVLYKGVKFG